MAQLSPIGIVHSPKNRGDAHYPFYCPAQIEIKEELMPALARLEENSHIWVICLYRPNKEPSLTCTPCHVDPNIAEFGALALRTPNHPNPIALTLTKLNKVEGNIIFVNDLDAYNGTEVLDIKPYYEHDMVFSPTTPLIKHHNNERRQEILWKLAFTHHQEECEGAALAVKMIMAVEEMGINIYENDWFILAKGNPCLADTLQGLCHARLANPTRFAYRETEQNSSRWVCNDKSIEITVRKKVSKDPQAILRESTLNLFYIKISEE